MIQILLLILFLSQAPVQAQVEAGTQGIIATIEAQKKLIQDQIRILRRQRAQALQGHPYHRQLTFEINDLEMDIARLDERIARELAKESARLRKEADSVEDVDSLSAQLEMEQQTLNQLEEVLEQRKVEYQLGLISLSTLQSAHRAVVSQERRISRLQEDIPP
jgi:hypothetical protein